MRTLRGGRILDVATKHGDFVKLLIESFASYEEAIGIDLSEESLLGARERHGAGIRFELVNAEDMAYLDDSFDTVAMRHSLHHLENIDTVLLEMMRVLRPDGLLVLCELFQDPADVRDNSHRHMHHWWAEVDVIRGEPHFPTLTRDEILRAAAPLHLDDKQVFEHREQFDAVSASELLSDLLRKSRQYLDYLRGLGGHSDLIVRGEELIDRFERHGFTPDKVLYVLGRKPTRRTRGRS